MVEDKEKRDGAFTVMGGLADAPKLFAPIAQYWMTEPQKFQAAQTKLNQDLIELWGRTYKRFLGEEVEPMVKHTPGDRASRTANGPRTRFSISCGRPIC